MPLGEHRTHKAIAPSAAHPPLAFPLSSPLLRLPHSPHSSRTHPQSQTSLSKRLLIIMSKLFPSSPSRPLLLSVPSPRSSAHSLLSLFPLGSMGASFAKLISIRVARGLYTPRRVRTHSPRGAVISTQTLAHTKDRTPSPPPNYTRRHTHPAIHATNLSDKNAVSPNPCEDHLRQDRLSSVEK